MKESPYSSRKNLLRRECPEPRWYEPEQQGRFRLALPGKCLQTVSLPAERLRRWSLRLAVNVTR